MVKQVRINYLYLLDFNIFTCMNPFMAFKLTRFLKGLVTVFTFVGKSRAVYITLVTSVVQTCSENKNLKAKIFLNLEVFIELKKIA